MEHISIGKLCKTKKINVKFEKKVEDKVVESGYKRKEVIVVNKEKTISIRRIKYYFFELPDRNIQRENNVYWKEVEQNYIKEKKYRLSMKRKKNLVLDKGCSKFLSCELASVSDNFGGNSRVYRDSKPEAICPF